MIVLNAKGTINDTITASGSIENIENSASVSVFDKAESVYEGEYTVTPSTEVQTLETAGMKMTQDVTIEAVDEYNGAYRLTPATSAQTLFTKDKMLTDNVILDAMPLYDGTYQITPSFDTAQELGTADQFLLNNVNVAKIDNSDTTAEAEDVFPGKLFRAADGTLTTGTLGALEKVQDLWTGNFTLGDTSFSTWTASTSATSILATANLGTFTADMENYIYIIKWKYRFDAQYLEGATLKAMPKRQCLESWQVLYRRFSSLAQLRAGTRPANAVATQFTAPVLEYYNTSGTDTLYISSTYGIYMTVQAATYSSTTSDTPKVTYKRPVIYARCNSSYFATTRKPYIDTASPFSIKAELWRVKVSSTIQDAYDGVQDVFNNGI